MNESSIYCFMATYAQTLESLSQWHIQEFQEKMKAKEREIIELQSQLAEAKVALERSQVRNWVNVIL